jgi:bla regulator protein blaR1
MRYIKKLWRVAFWGFAIIGFLTVSVALVVGLAYEFRKIDNVDLPFADDPQALGWWTAVAYVGSPGEFSPRIDAFSSNARELFFKSMELRPGGNTERNWVTWTKGVILNHGGPEHTASKYEIREMDGAKYMFYEWKSGDYTYLHRRPAYYVLKWSGDPGQPIADKIDLPFVDDPAAVGHWMTVDFVSVARDFSPNSRKWQEELYLKEVTLLPGGQIQVSGGQAQEAFSKNDLWTWTKAAVVNSAAKTASRYEIRNIDGTKYMFLEWKSGDYTIRHIRPFLYVLRWSGNAATTQATQPNPPR